MGKIFDKVAKFFDDHSGLLLGLTCGAAAVSLGVASDMLLDSLRSAGDEIEKEKQIAQEMGRRADIMEDALVLTRYGLHETDTKVGVRNAKGEINDLRDVLKDLSKQAGVKIKMIGDDWDIPEGHVVLDVPMHKAGEHVDPVPVKEEEA